MVNYNDYAATGIVIDLTARTIEVLDQDTLKYIKEITQENTNEQGINLL